jgi:MFS family permease
VPRLTGPAPALPGGFGAADVAELERAIAQAIASAFLLTGIFGLLNVLAGRLARVIERERAIRNKLSPALPGERRRLSQRARCAHNAITGCVVAAILLCLLIVVAFVGVFLGLRVAWVLSVLLIAAMLALIGALGLFLQEVRLAAQHLPLQDDD